MDGGDDSDDVDDDGFDDEAPRPELSLELSPFPRHAPWAQT